jgi:CRP-like cAMP-binding protein
MRSEHSPSGGLRGLMGISDWARLVQSGVRRLYVRGDQLVRQGDDSDWVLLVVAGRVKVTRAAVDGSELLLAVRGPGDVVGEFAMQDSEPRSASVMALEPCVAHLVTSTAFRTFIENHRHLPELMRYATAKNRESATRALYLVSGRPETRLAALFLMVITAAGADHPHPYEIPMSQEELARALGLARSSVTPVLAAWKHQGVIEASRARVQVLDLSALRILAPAW